MEVVSEDVGIKVDTGDVENLANAISKLDSNKNYWDNLSGNCREYALKNFSKESMVKKYESILEINK